MMGMRSLLALLLAASAALAGCLATPGDLAPSATLDGVLTPGTEGVFHSLSGEVLAVADRVVASGGQYSLGLSATEPTVGVTKDGAVFMTAFARDGATGRSFPTIARSMDKGQTFEVVGPRLPTGDGLPPVTNDPYVYVDPATDRVYMLDLIGTVCSVLSWSDDQGASWTTNPLACGTPFVNDHQTMVAAKPRAMPLTLYDSVVYYCVNRVADTSCATSLDGGLTFTPLRTVFTGVPASDPADLCGGLSGHVKAGPDGKVYLPRSYCGPATVAITEDDGLTWTHHVIDTEHLVEGHEVSIAVDEANNVYAVWTSGGRIWFSSSTDGGHTWAPARDVTAPGVTATMFNTIAAAGEGKVAFAYVGSTVEGGYEGKDTGYGGVVGDILGEPAPAEWQGATWNAYLGVILDATSEDAVVQTVTANDPADPVARGLCGRTRCNGMNDFIDVVIDAEGRPWAAFVDVCTQECVTDDKVWSDRAVGFVGTFVTGPSLLAGQAELPPILPPPVAASD